MRQDRRGYKASKYWSNIGKVGLRKKGLPFLWTYVTLSEEGSLLFRKGTDVLADSIERILSETIN